MYRKKFLLCVSKCSNFSSEKDRRDPTTAGAGEGTDLRVGAGGSYVSARAAGAASCTLAAKAVEEGGCEAATGAVLRSEPQLESCPGPGCSTVGATHHGDPSCLRGPRAGRDKRCCRYEAASLAVGWAGIWRDVHRPCCWLFGAIADATAARARALSVSAAS